MEVSKPKRIRNKTLLKLRKENPRKWTFGILSKKFQISRQRAAQVIEEEKKRSAMKR